MTQPPPEPPATPPKKKRRFTKKHGTAAGVTAALVASIGIWAAATCTCATPVFNPSPPPPPSPPTPPPPPPPPLGNTFNLFMDANGGSCTPHATPAVYVDSEACSGMNAAYAAASPGYSVGIETAAYGDQTILNSNAKALSFTCRWGGPFLASSTTAGTSTEARDLSGCIQFAPDSGQTPTFDNLNIQVPYVYLNGLTLTGARNGSHGGLTFQSNSLTCSPNQWTDLIVRDTTMFQFNLMGASHVYLIGITKDPQNSNQVSQIRTCNYNNTNGVHAAGQFDHIMIDGSTIKNQYYDNIPSCCQHTEGIHWYGGNFITVRNSYFLNNAIYAISFASIAETTLSTDHVLIENNVFDASCSHQFFASGCTNGINSPGAGTALPAESNGSFLFRFNTMWDSGPTNTDFVHLCDVRAGAHNGPCADMRVYGNLMGPMNGFQCTSVFSSTVYQYNVFTNLPGTSTSGCGTNSILPTVEQLDDPANYDYTLASCSVAAANAVPASITGGVPATDILGNPRPKPGNANVDAGAYEQCP
jgi:hypothetical protein